MSGHGATATNVTGQRASPGGRGEKVVAAVHAATLALLEERGYDRMEIPEIAERAGVNKTSIYRRWPSKTELVLDVALARIRTSVPILNTGTLAGDLTALLNTIAAALATPFVGGLLRALISRGEHDVAVQQARIAFWNERLALAGKIVERAIDRGEISAGTDSRQLLELAAAPLFFRALVTSQAITTEDIETIARRTIAAFRAS